MPPPPPSVIPVFVSSTWLDLEEERRAVEKVLNQFRETKFQGMEYFGSRPEGARAASLEEVGWSRLYIGVFGRRYGSGITEAEYRHAFSRQLPCLLYVKRNRHSDGSSSEPPQEALIAELRRNANQLVTEFETADELALRVAVDLHRWLFDSVLIPHLQQVAQQHSSKDAIGRVPGAVVEPLSLGADLLRDLRSAGYAVESTPPNDTDEARQLNALAIRVEQGWIRGVLERTVHAEAMIAIGKEGVDDAVDVPWSRHVQLGLGLARIDDEWHSSILEVFAQTGRFLLILGEPGSGKTITLLELTRDLMALRAQGVEYAVPVVVSLSTWRAHYGDFSNWCVSALSATYQVPKKLARSWLSGHRLTLMLDGLDEVPAKERDTCVAAINVFVTGTGAPGVVVTCRSGEHAALATPVRLSGGVRLKPLTDMQIDEYLDHAGPRLDGLRDVLHYTDELRMLARTPLMLSIMCLAYADAPDHVVRIAAPVLKGSESRAHGYREALFDLYLDQMFRYRKVAARQRERIERHLSWVARSMQRRGTSAFWLEGLQPTWLNWPSIVVYLCAVPMIAATPPFLLVVSDIAAEDGFAVIYAAVGCSVIDAARFVATANVRGSATLTFRRFLSILWLIAYFAVPFVIVTTSTSSTFIASFIGLWLVGIHGFRSAFRSGDSDVRVADEMTWSWRHAIPGVGYGLLVAAFTITVSETAELFSDQRSVSEFLEEFVKTVRQDFLTVASDKILQIAMFCIAGFLISGLRATVRQHAVRPYDRFRRTVSRSLIIAAALGGTIGLWAWWGDGSEAAASGGLVCSLFAWFAFGGIDVIRHTIVPAFACCQWVSSASRGPRAGCGNITRVSASRRGRVSLHSSDDFGVFRRPGCDRKGFVGRHA